MNNSYKAMFCLLLTVIFVHGATTQAAAQNPQPSFRQMNENELKRFADNNTYWKRHTLDHFYFNSDGTFIQQLNDRWNGIPEGTMFTGTWNINGGNMCWTYSQETRDVYKTSIDPYCYAVLTDSPASSFMTTHAEIFRLYPLENGIISQDPAFEWQAWVYGNYILDPEYAPKIKDALDVMSSYRRNGKIDNGTINRADLNADMQAYYDLVADRIFYVTTDRMLFRKDGMFFYISGDDINEAKGDVDKMIAAGSKGYWTMKDNIHCWYLSENRSSCEYVLPKGKGLVRSYDGFMGVHYNAFTRVYTEGDVGHMDPDDSNAPELFNKLINAQ